MVSIQATNKTLPKAQRTQGIEHFESINTFSSKQKLQQDLKSWSSFSLVGKCREVLPQEVLLGGPDSLFRS